MEITENKKQTNYFMRRQLAVFLSVLLTLTCSLLLPVTGSFSLAAKSTAPGAMTYAAYSGSPYVVINGNEPNFTAAEKIVTEPFEYYSDLDLLGRCGIAYANICIDIMPTESRGSISSVHPTGWQSNMGWQRCHLIGFQLAGENANEKNLITGTNYFNTTAMLPFENMIADYVKETGSHVLYRVTPVFEGVNLIASGVQMEAWSVEDEGEGICFNVFCYNVQPGKTIDYITGMVKTAGNASKITLKDKTEVYTGKAISIGKASVKGSAGTVSYMYYVDEACITATDEKNSGAAAPGMAPVNVGTYYVKAAVAEDANYGSAVSKIARLTIEQSETEITLKNSTKAYTGKAISIPKATVKGSTGKVTYTYYTDKQCKVKTTAANSGASGSGKAPVNVGTYYVKAKAAADRNCKSAVSAKAKLVIKQGTQQISVGTISKVYSDADLNSHGESFSINIKASGKITCEKVSGSSALKVSKNGQITVAKGTGAGEYSIQVRIKAEETVNCKKNEVLQTINVTVLQSAPSFGNYVLNTNTRKFHIPTCRSVSQMKDKNKRYSSLGRDEIIGQGYAPCKICNP